MRSIETKRPGQSPSGPDLVQSLVDGETRFDAYLALVEMGADAIPAIREGLAHHQWEVRRWCAMCLDQIADPESLDALVPLLRDPKSKVRLWAVHSISCEHCTDAKCTVDVVPLLVERVELDESLRVRRMATAMLGSEFLDRRAVPTFERVLAEEEDRKLIGHAQRGLDRYREAGVAE